MSFTLFHKHMYTKPIWALQKSYKEYRNDIQKNESPINFSSQLHRELNIINMQQFCCASISIKYLVILK